MFLLVVVDFLPQTDSPIHLTLAIDFLFIYISFLIDLDRLLFVESLQTSFDLEEKDSL